MLDTLKTMAIILVGIMLLVASWYSVLLIVIVTLAYYASKTITTVKKVVNEP